MDLVIHGPTKALGRHEPPFALYRRMASEEGRISSLAPWELNAVHMVLWYS